MTVDLRPRLVALLAALVVSLAGGMVSSAAGGQTKRAARVEARAGARIGLADRHAVAPINPCLVRLARRPRERATHWRSRRTHRLQRCRRNRKRVATDSSYPPSPIYWGAWIGSQLTGDQAPWDMSAVTKFAGMAGKPLSLIHFSSPFADCSSSPCSFYGFPAGPMENIRNYGAIPVFSWGSQSTPVPASLNEPNFQLSDVINGAYDSYIRSFAEEARDWGHPFFLRFNWEMNGNWFAWDEGANGNSPGEYVAAWRHVHDIFTSVGATNATWVWCPNVDPGNKLQNLASLYPGNEYVDWTGLDGYNWGTNPARPDRWRTFDQLYSSTYRDITERIAPSKPMIVSEVGSTEYGGSKATWISEMLSTVPVNYPKIHGLLWFERYEDGMDWPIETSSSATSAFAAGIQNPAYLGNSYGSLGPEPVQAPN